MDVQKAIRLARKHIGKGSMESSARLCLSDALRQYDDGNFESAQMWALKSLAYSIGIFHQDYKRAQ